MSGLAIFPCKFGCVHDAESDAFVLRVLRTRIQVALLSRDPDATREWLARLERAEKRQAEHAAYHAGEVSK